MNRRDFISLLGGAAAWPVAARGQRAAMPVIGFLFTTSADSIREELRAFHQGLKQAGYVEGDNVIVAYRWAEGRNDRLPGLAAELVRQEVSVIASANTTSTLVAKSATTTIPIVFRVSEDPTRLGLVSSLSRPGGNMTGANFFSGELVARRRSTRPTITVRWAI